MSESEKLERRTQGSLGPSLDFSSRHSRVKTMGFGRPARPPPAEPQVRE